MKKSKMLIVIAMLISLFFCGCSRNAAAQTPTQCRLVTGVHIRFDDGPIHLERQYTASAKVRAILNYLRWLDPYGLPEEDPETISGSSFQITVQYSDGCQKDYIQKANRFLWEEGKSWKQINPIRALTLSQILGKMPGD